MKSVKCKAVELGGAEGWFYGFFDTDLHGIYTDYLRRKLKVKSEKMWSRRKWI